MIVGLERLGTGDVTVEGREWAEALAAMGERVDVVVRDVFASTPRGVRRLR